MTVKRGDWVKVASGYAPNLEGFVKRVARDGSWADVDWGTHVKRMPCSSLKPVATIKRSIAGVPCVITDLVREKELRL